MLINNKTVDNNFEKNPLCSAKVPQIDPIRFEDLIHTETKQYSQSYFQGHLNTVASTAEAKATLSALLQNPDVAKAHHIIYAYTIGEGKDKVDGHSDDGETGASDILKTLIEERRLTNTFLAVSRCHNGPNLGKRRYELMRSTALDALSKKDNTIG